MKKTFLVFFLILFAVHSFATSYAPSPSQRLFGELERAYLQTAFEPFSKSAPFQPLVLHELRWSRESICVTENKSNQKNLFEIETETKMAGEYPYQSTMIGFRGEETTTVNARLLCNENEFNESEFPIFEEQSSSCEPCKTRKCCTLLLTQEQPANVRLYGGSLSIKELNQQQGQQKLWLAGGFGLFLLLLPFLVALIGIWKNKTASILKVMGILFGLVAVLLLLSLLPALLYGLQAPPQSVNLLAGVSFTVLVLAFVLIPVFAYLINRFWLSKQMWNPKIKKIAEFFLVFISFLPYYSFFLLGLAVF